MLGAPNITKKWEITTRYVVWFDT